MKETIISNYATIPDLSIKGDYHEAFTEVLTKEAQEFLVALHQHFNARRKELLQKREEQQAAIDAGDFPDFPEETKSIRESDWKVAALPADLLDRRVEITGPVDRKMVINALNSGAKVFMADFEDSNSPTWFNAIQGQINMRDAINRSIRFKHPTKDKVYELNEQVATMMVRPRGWHLEEKHLFYKDEPMSGSLVDFGLYFFHNAKTLLQKGSGPYFYLPKLEHYLEARLWNDVFVFAQSQLDIPQGSIKATVLVETILASFQLNEILYELREHSAGLNCGRWDYIFSFIKRFRNVEGYVMPDRSDIGMTVPFMRAYTQLVVKTCHRRGVHAMGGMAAQIPIKGDEKANQQALEKVRTDKKREVQDGHDGSWVAHPGLVSLAMEVFDEGMPKANQIANKREDVEVSAAELIEAPEGKITEKGLRLNINVGVLYIESWLRGNGAAAIYHLMEDAATAEISRTQVWQWIKAGAKLQEGPTVTLDLCKELLKEELKKIEDYVGAVNYANGRFDEAVELFLQLIAADEFVEFLTLPAYERLQA